MFLTQRDIIFWLGIEEILGEKFPNHVKNTFRYEYLNCFINF